MYFLISLTINAIAFLCVLKFSKKWSILSLVAGILGFIIYLSSYQELSGGMYGFAAAYDQNLALLKFWYFILMLFWLVVAIRGGVKIFKGKDAAQMAQSFARTVNTITAPISSGGSNLDEIKKAKELLDAGAIDASEFEKIKKKALES